MKNEKKIKTELKEQIRKDRQALAAGRPIVMHKDSSRADGWQNILTGIGVDGVDSRTAATVQWDRMSWNDQEALYAADPIAQKVVDLIPQEGSRRGFDIGGMDKDTVEILLDKFKALNGPVQMQKSWSWSRMYGGVGILVGVEDGEEDLSQPLDIHKVKRVKSLTPLHRWELYYTGSAIVNDITSPFFGLPVYYNVVTSRAINVPAIKVHYSRIIRFEGAPLPQRLFIANYYWHDSVLNRLYNTLRNFNSAHDSCSVVVNNFKQAVMTIKGLADILASDDGEKDIIKRVAVLNQVRSVLKTAVIDEGETYQNVVTNVAGLKDLMEQINGRMVADTGLPHTVILGTSPTGGLSGKGESENRDFYDRISSEQERVVRPVLERLFWLIINSQEFSQVSQEDSDKLEINFRSLWQMDDKQVAELHYSQAQADTAYIQAGVLTPSEVAISRFGGDKYNLETAIDPDAHTPESDGRTGKEGNEPEPPPEPQPKEKPNGKN